MKRSDPDTWPKREGLVYRQSARKNSTAHAFPANRITSVCNVSLDRSRNVIPTEGYSRLCLNCIGGMMTLGWMPRSEVVEC